MTGVSIIIPTLNEAENVRILLGDLARLQTHLQKGHTAFEVVVVDGGSRDATCEIAAQHGARVLTSPPTRGGQLQAGYLASQGELLWFLHADSRVGSEVWDALAALIGERVWGRFDVQLGDAPVPFGFRVLSWTMNLRSRLTCIATGDQGIFVERTLLVEAGGVPNQPLMEDIALSLRLRRLRPPVCLSERLQTSRRKWQRDGLVRGTWRIFRIRLAYAWGASPALLAKRYYRESQVRM